METLSENVTFQTLPRVLSQFGCEILIWCLRLRVCDFPFLHLWCLWHLLIQTSENHVQEGTSPTLEHWILALHIPPCVFLTLILERLLQHAEGLLGIQQAHENRTPLFPCWCVCVFSWSTCPADVGTGKEEGRVFCPLWQTCTLVICTHYVACAFTKRVDTKTQTVSARYCKKVREEEDGA